MISVMNGPCDAEVARPSNKEKESVIRNQGDFHQ